MKIVQFFVPCNKCLQIAHMFHPLIIWIKTYARLLHVKVLPRLFPKFVKSFWKSFCWTFTVRQRSCGKVGLMFSVVYVCVFTGDSTPPLPMFHWFSLCWETPLPALPPRHRTSKHGYPPDMRPHCTAPALVRTPCWWHLVVRTGNLEELPGGGYWSTYSQQADGTHPTGMLSCASCYSKFYPLSHLKCYIKLSNFNFQRTSVIPQ